MFLHKTPRIIQWWYSGLNWRIPTNEKVIYLTFDDGPIPEVTPWVLEQLDHFGAKATFFCVGENVERNPEIFKSLIEAGHSIGNHTFNHLNGWETETKEYLTNVEKAQAVMDRHYENQFLFRPPYGRIKRQQISRMKEYRIIMWDVLTGDYRKDSEPEGLLKGSIRNTRPGSIVVFHDHKKAFSNLQYMLPKYLEHFQEQRYEFRAL